MKLRIYFEDLQHKISVGYQLKILMRRAVEATLMYEGIDNDVEVSITFTDDESIHRLNLEYRGIDRPTDVLSFEEYEDDYLGEIFICEEKVYEQAVSYNHSNEREFAFLLTHGLLHLLGYDHIEKEDEIVMFAKQDELLNKTIYRRN